MVAKKGICEIKIPHFVPNHENLIDILTDHSLASLGDAFVNLIYSLYLSKKNDKPIGKKIDSSTLAVAVKSAGLRDLLPSRTDRHKQADAAESLIAYAWLTNTIDFDETIRILEEKEDLKEGFTVLLQIAADKFADNTPKKDEDIRASNLTNSR